MSKENLVQTAILYSNIPPTELQENRFITFLTEKYGKEISLVWKQDNSIQGGFKLQVGCELYDWSVNGRFLQFKEAISKIKNKEEDIIPLLKETVQNWTPQALSHEVGKVLTVGDGIATVNGLEPFLLCQKKTTGFRHMLHFQGH